MTNTHSPIGPASRIGIDIGRVLMGVVDAHGRADTAFLAGGEDEAMKTPPADGAFPVVRRLHELLPGRVALVSKAGPRVAARTLRWLDAHRFYDATGLSPGDVRFCRERHEKRGIAASLGLTHFVDDRLDVLRHLEGVVPSRFLFGRQRADLAIPKGIFSVADWRAAARALLGVDGEELGRHALREPDAVGGQEELVP